MGLAKGGVTLVAACGARGPIADGVVPATARQRVGHPAWPPRVGGRSSGPREKRGAAHGVRPKSREETPKEGMRERDAVAIPHRTN